MSIIVPFSVSDLVGFVSFGRIRFRKRWSGSGYQNTGTFTEQIQKHKLEADLRIHIKTGVYIFWGKIMAK